MTGCSNPTQHKYILYGKTKSIGYGLLIQNMLDVYYADFNYSDRRYAFAAQLIVDDKTWDLTNVGDEYNIMAKII